MFSIDDLYRAYRKAKHEAFSDATHPALLEFARYEQSLHKNLLRLRKLLSNRSKPWHARKELVAGYAYLPKKIESEDSSSSAAHFSSGDQTVDWSRRFGAEREKADVEFRLVIVPTVDLQIISALWVLFVGRSYDSALDNDIAYANRPRKAIVASIGSSKIADDSYALFSPYFSGYRKWRERGLDAMREAVERGEAVTAITMDAQRYYHSISPRFLLSPAFLKRNNITLTREQEAFTSDFVAALEHWHRLTPEFHNSSMGAVPVGLSASKIIANVLLAEFDRVVVSSLECRYYGRYVDDIFLVVSGAEHCQDAEAVMGWIRQRLDGYVVLDRPKGGAIGLRISLPYLQDCKIIFAGSKQKIFKVSGPHGMDLVNQISEQIRRSSSEYRLIPSLKEFDEVLSGLLLASTNASDEPDTLRKAEGMSIRRHGLSIATRNLEGYARDIAPEAWMSKRSASYGLIGRHVITPVGIFNYAKFVVRVFGVMISCGDWLAAVALLDKVNAVLIAIREGIDQERCGYQLESMADVYSRNLLEAAIAASTVAGFSFDSEFRRIVRRLDPTCAVFEQKKLSESAVVRASRQMLLADLGRRPYKDYWYNENPVDDVAPRVPDVAFVRQLVDLLVGLRGKFHRKLRDPYWPALAFATRPPSLPEMCLMMPTLMMESGGIARALMVVRGAGVPPTCVGTKLMSPNDRWLDCQVPFYGRKSIKVAVPSYLTTDVQYESALRGKPDLSVERYEGLTTLINSIIERVPNVDYIALPECSVPFSWAFSIAKNLSRVGVSFLCGVEPSPRKRQYRNDALVSLSTTFGGYRSSIIFRQPKIQLAHKEAASVAHAKLRKYSPPTHPLGRPIYEHGDFIFSVLLCSDLTNINNRRALQGEIDGLFVLEWNPDVDTFSYLVESASHDLHAPIIQINNRQYGDSRVRAPYKVDYKRDLVRVKGGDTDFYAIASFDHHELRKFQKLQPRVKADKSSAKNVKVDAFKPLPIGYKLSSRRSPRRKAS